MAWMAARRGVPPRSHHPMTGYHHATRPPSEDDTWCRMKAMPYHATLCYYPILYQAIPLQYHDASSQASEDDTWCGMKAYGRRGRATVRSSDHSLAITCPNLPLPPTTGYFVKPTIPFDRISSHARHSAGPDIYGTGGQADQMCALHSRRSHSIQGLYGPYVRWHTVLFFRLNGREK